MNKFSWEDGDVEVLERSEEHLYNHAHDAKGRFGSSGVAESVGTPGTQYGTSTADFEKEQEFNAIPLSDQPGS